MFFFEKKNQKTFTLRPWPENKSLLLLFFRKEDLSSYLIRAETLEVHACCYRAALTSEMWSFQKFISLKNANCGVHVLVRFHMFAANRSFPTIVLDPDADTIEARQRIFDTNGRGRLRRHRGRRDARRCPRARRRDGCYKNCQE
jgi:hypothetical protein